MALPRIRIDVETTFGGGSPEVVACYFDRLCPLPLNAHGDFMAAIAEADGTPDGDKGDKAASAIRARAWAAFFDASCKEARHGDDPIPFDALDWRIKLAAMSAINEQWESRVKAPGGPSAATS